MVRVIHTGDTHLGYRQYHAPERREDFLDAFRSVVEDAVEDDVDAVVHAGDLYHDRSPGLRDILGTISVLRPLRDAGIPFLAIVGNHEGTRDAQWLDLFETLGLAERLDGTGRRVDDTVFYGLDYVPESKRDDLDYEFDPPDDDAEFSALVSHGLFTPFPHANWDTDEVLRESNVDFDAVLLGDNHTADTAQVEDTWVTYCGSTERASASERDPRGYNVVEFADEVGISRKGLDTREFVFVDVELGPEDGTGYVRERVRERDVEDAVVIVTVEGDGENVTPAEVEQFGDELGALLTRVNDRREVDTETDVEVSFADPDEAVRERVREMGLSEAGLDVDETVRDLGVADSNVRERVKQRVEDALDESTADSETDADADDSSAGEDVDDSAADVEDADDSADDDTGEEFADDERSEESVSEERSDAVSADESGDESGEGAVADSDDEPVDESSSDESTGDGTRTATMEEFL